MPRAEFWTPSFEGVTGTRFGKLVESLQFNPERGATPALYQACRRSDAVCVSA
jgi:hypothetical protein